MTEGVQVASDSSDKTYTVHVGKIGTTVPDTCTCQGWVMTRNRAAKKQGIPKGPEGREEREAVPATCKHVDAVIASTCMWIQGKDDRGFIDSCPTCGGPTVDLDDGPVDDVDVEVAEFELRNLLREMQGEEPLPEPTPAGPPDELVALIDEAIRATNNVWCWYRDNEGDAKEHITPSQRDDIDDACQVMNGIRDSFNLDEPFSKRDDSGDAADRLLEEMSA